MPTVLQEPCRGAAVAVLPPCFIFACMNSIKLSAYYRLYAFSDYRSMKTALPYMQRVVLATPLQEVGEADARRIVWRVPGLGYKNYLGPLSGRRTKGTAVESLVTALQELYKQNGYSARYVVVERC